MPGFDYYDPPEIRTQAMLRHEAAHAILAYEYGFRISRFRFIWTGTEWGGAVRTEENIDFSNADPVGSCHAKAIQLFVGEIAARRYATVTNDRMSLPVPGSPHFNQHTPIQAIPYPSPNYASHDIIKIVDLARKLGHHHNWWQWFWSGHAQARQIVEDRWSSIEQLAVRFSVAEPPPTASKRLFNSGVNLIRAIPGFGRAIWKRGAGRVEGADIVRFCKSIRVTPRNPLYSPSSFVCD